MPNLPALNGEVLPPARSPRRLPPGYTVADRRSDGFVLRRHGADTRVLLDDDMLRWSTAEYISETFLARMARLRNLERKAPRGDSHGAWQKVCEVPLTWLLGQVPVLEDEKAVNRLLNDSDYRKLRCDGNHRRL